MHLEYFALAVMPAPQANGGDAGRMFTAQPTSDADPHASTLKPARSSSPRILLAEDSDDLRSIARVFLQAEGYEVLACADGERAIGMLKSGVEPDLLLTDIEMPHATGIEVAAVAAALYPKLPIVIVSGAVLMESTLQQMKSAGWTFFAKPFPLPNLLATVHERLQAAGRIGTPLPA